MGLHYHHSIFYNRIRDADSDDPVIMTHWDVSIKIATINQYSNKIVTNVIIYDYYIREYYKS